GSSDVCSSDLPPPPGMLHPQEARQQRGVQERLVDAKAVPGIRRIPGVGARWTVQVTKGIAPAGAIEALHPGAFALVEARGLLVYARAARVRFAETHSGRAAPRFRHARW